MAAWITKTALTLLLCAACWWLGTSNVRAAEWLGLGYLDLAVRALEIVLVLSLSDALLEHLPQSLQTSQSDATHHQ